MARILLIDDEPDIRTSTKLLLEQGGHEILMAEDGAAGLKILERERPDLIFLDIMMLGMNGWEVYERITATEELKDIPVVMFTVKTTRDSKHEIEEFKPQAYITKPFDNMDLLAVVKELTEKD